MLSVKNRNGVEMGECLISTPTVTSFSSSAVLDEQERI